MMRKIEINGKFESVNVLRKSFYNKLYRSSIFDENSQKVMDGPEYYVWSPLSNMEDSGLNLIPNDRLASFYSFAKRLGLLEKNNTLVLCRNSDLLRVPLDRWSGQNNWVLYDPSELVPVQEVLNRAFRGG